MTFNASATLYRATLDNAELSFPVMAGQKALFYIFEGDAACNGAAMETGSHARIAGEELIRLYSANKAECIFVLMRTDF